MNRLNTKLVQLNDYKNKIKGKVLNNAINTYWWRGVKNFGDLLTPELLTAYGYTPNWNPIIESEFIGVGSIVQQLPPNYSGIVLGSGLIDDNKFELPDANFLAVRGALSRKNLGLSSELQLGDLGLLSHKLLSKNVSKKYKIGLIPHYVDIRHPWIVDVSNYLGDSGVVIDVRDTATNVTNKIAECEMIFSSSLHGIIVSDSLSIPNVWIVLSDRVFGNGFKFFDYGSSIDYEEQPINIVSTSTLKYLEGNISHKNHNYIQDVSLNLENIFVQACNK